VKAVLFDWRGTLVVTMSESAWIERALQQTGRDSSPDAVARITVALAKAMEHPDVQRRWGRVDESADVHRETHARLFRVAVSTTILPVRCMRSNRTRPTTPSPTTSRKR
jgi:beta-phosphoglucomutase-like phosphatase (HAD superfamily)